MKLARPHQFPANSGVAADSIIVVMLSYLIWIHIGFVHRSAALGFVTGQNPFAGLLVQFRAIHLHFTFTFSYILFWRKKFRAASSQKYLSEMKLKNSLNSLHCSVERKEKRLSIWYNMEFY